MTFRMNCYHVLLAFIPSICHSYVITSTSLCNGCRSNEYTGSNRCPSNLWNRPTKSVLRRHAFLNNDKQLEAEVLTTSSLEKGLYRPFVDYAWQQLLQTQESTLSLVNVPIELGYKETIAPGPRSNNTVRITIQAATSNQTTNVVGSIQYARFALIETIQTSSTGSVDLGSEETIEQKHAFHTDGIQVLNMVIVPYKHTGLPVFGADFVALPGNKHLLLLDAQPVRSDGDDTNNSMLQYDDWFQTWYERNDIQTQFEWGGDLPEPVQQYVSKYALWTRFTGTTGSSSDNTTGVPNGTISNPIEIIQGPVMDVFMDHFQTYMKLLDDYESSSVQRFDNTNSSRLLDYLTYRLDNDPARPMLKRLFGAEWTEQALHDILFPIHLF